MRRGMWPLRDLPVLGWLLTALVVAVVNPAVPAPRWLLIHVLLLGAASHSILVWSRHFCDALLHTAATEDARRRQSHRLLLLNLGALAVLVGVSAQVWPLAVAGATAVAGVALWHGATIAGELRRALPSRFAPTARYYVAASCLLPVGAAVGAWLAHGIDGPLEERVVLAHVTVNVLGWVGLTVVGTLVTLWPTMLRTRIDPRAEAAARRALPALLLALAVVVAGALAGQRYLAAAGLLGYLAALVGVAGPWIATARRKRPTGYATRSVAAALGWLAGCLAFTAGGVALARSWADVGPLLDGVAPVLAVGFGAQLLLGAMSYLLPTALGGGPAAVRAGGAELDLHARLRVLAANGALVVCVLPVPTSVRTTASAVVLLSLAAFPPLLGRAIRASRRARLAPTAATG